MNRHLIRLALSSLTYLLLITVATTAEPMWTPEDGRAVYQAANTEDATSTVLADGSVLVVWSDGRTGLRTAYGQRLDGEGNPLWPENGIALTSGQLDLSFPQESLKVFPLSDGGFALIWPTPAPDDMLRTQRFDSAANPVWDNGGDRLAGLPLMPYESSQSQSFFVQQDSEDGAFIVTQHLEYNNEHWIRLHHLLPTGQLDPEWPAGGVTIVEDPDTEYRCKGLILADDLSRDLLLCWMANDSTYLNRVDHDGNPVWLGVTSLFGYTDVQLVSDGEGGAFVKTSREPGRLSRVNATGDVLWTEDNMAGDLRGLVPSQPGTAIIAWIESNTGYAQRVGGEDYTTFWNEPASLVSFHGSHTTDGEGGMVFLGGYDGSGFCHLHADGTLLVGPGQLPLHSEDYGNDAFHVMGNGRILIHFSINYMTQWEDYHYMQSFVQLYDPDQAVLLLPHPGLELTTGSLSGAVLMDVLTCDNTAWLTWMDTRRRDGEPSLPVNRRPFVQALDMESGEPLFANDVEPFPNELTAVFSTSSVWKTVDSDETALYVRNENRRSYQKIGSDGGLRWGENGAEPILPYPVDITSSPEWIPDGTGGIVVLNSYRDYATQTRGILGRRIDSSGQHVWTDSDDESVLVLTDYPEDEYYSVSPFGILREESGSINTIYWRRRGVDSINEICLLKVSLNAEVLLDTILFEVTNDSLAPFHVSPFQDGAIVPYRHSTNGIYSYQCIGFDGSVHWAAPLEFEPGDPAVLQFGTQSDSAASFWALLKDDDYGLFAQRYASDGHPLLQPPSGVALGTVGNSGTVEMVVLEDNSMVVAWRTEPGTEIVTRRIMPDGSFPPGQEAGPEVVSDVPSYYNNVHVTRDGDGGVVVGWEDSRGKRYSWPAMAGVYAQRMNDGYSSFRQPAVFPTPLPLAMELASIYPNPFNPVATTTLRLPTSGQVSVRVFDILGREVSQLHDGRLSAGVHQLTIDGTSWASGLYFIRAEAEGQLSCVQKCVLLK